MNAPALVLLSTGPADARSAPLVAAIAGTTARMRPDLDISWASCEGGASGLPATVARLRSEGHEEIVAVPLLVAPTEQDELAVVVAMDAAARATPQCRVRAGQPIGAEPGLLTVLDERLRSILSLRRVRELDALVLASTGSSDPRVDVAVARLARLWSTHHHLPTSVAFAEVSPPSAGEAVRQFRRQGKRHVAVGSLFLTPGPRSARASELASEAGACAVSAPLGSHEEVSRLLLARYSVTALELIPV